MFPFSAIFFSPCNWKRSEEKPNIYPASTHNSIHKHHKVSFTKLQIDNFSKTFRLSCVLCWVAAGARSKAPRNEATETIIFIHNPLRASDLFYEWKISWKSKRGSFGRLQRFIFPRLRFPPKSQNSLARVLSESVLWDFHSRELEDPIDTLTEPFIKRKINNKRICTMKLENIKQTKSGND